MTYGKFFAHVLIFFSKIPIKYFALVYYIRKGLFSPFFIRLLINEGIKKTEANASAKPLFIIESQFFNSLLKFTTST